MNKVLIIGCGGVANVTIRKCCQLSNTFHHIMIASRTKKKCDDIKLKLENQTKSKLYTAELNADNLKDIIVLIKTFKPNVVINLALPYQDLTIMQACLITKTNYIDTANFESPNQAKFEYKEQWNFFNDYKKANITAILGCGFDPGVTGVFAAYALKHHFDEIHTIDILDANDGKNKYPFATNFNPEINIREITANGKYWYNNKWITTQPLEIKKQYNFPDIGIKNIYLLYHEELESLVKNIKTLKRIRFFMTFSDNYLMYLNCLKNIGMTSIIPVKFENKEIIPLQFLKTILPDPAVLGKNTFGKTNIGCIFQGIKNNKLKKYYIYNVCDHQKCYNEVEAQAISYTTGIPAMIGAKLLLEKTWNKYGVYNVEEFNPDPFMQELNNCGLPWVENFNPILLDD